MQKTDPFAFLNGGGDLGGLMRAFDWASTPLGPVERWPQSLKTATSLILRSPLPMVMLWGGDGIMIYNDAYSVFAGGRHPQLLGSKVREGWPEVADFNDHVMTVGLAGGTLAYKDQELTLHRYGEPERVWMNLDYSPVLDESGEPAGVLAVVIETTERVRAERDLREERDRSRGVLDGMAEGFVLLDRDFRILAVNEEALRMENRPREALVGRMHWEAYPGTETSEIGLLYKRAMADRVPVSLDHHHHWGDGRDAWLEMRAYPVDDGLAIFFRDVTDRHAAAQALREAAETAARQAAERSRSEAALRDTEERYRLAAGATRDAIWDWDLRSNHVLWNEAVHTMFGYGHDQVEPTGDWWIGHIHPDDRARINASIHAVIDTDGVHWTDEYRFLNADGGHVHVLDRGFVLRDGEGRPVRMIGAMFDLTQRRRTEQLLRESGERFRAAVDAVRGVLWTNTPTGEMLGEQPGWAALTGQGFEDYQGFGWASAVHPNDARPTIDAWNVAVAERRPFAFEHRVRCADGEWRLHAIRAVPTFDADGEIIEWVGVHIDVTDQRAAERALRELNETLETRVADEVAERGKAEEALRQAQKMEAVGQLTGGIAHDFNNLLTIVVGNTDMARRALAAGEIARANRAVDQAQKGAERAAALTQRLLAFSRRQPLAPKPIDVDRLVAGMADLLHRALGETIRLETVTNPGLWRVEVDPNQLESAILNLAVNARDAMSGGGQLTVETANARLDESYSAAHAEVAPGQYVVIAVTDTGGGMSKETLARVFEPFFTTKEVGKGTGLGLSMVYGFTKQSGGHVKIYSEEGEGTTIKIYLPRLLSAGEEELEAGVSAQPDTIGREETILVVEDDDDVRAYTVEILRELGYRVLEAHDGPAALRLLERQADEIRLMFTDVVMPGMSGRDLADKARAFKADLKVLYTSGYTRNAIVHGGRLDAGVELIPKPFTYAALAEKVRDVLDAGSTGRLLVVENAPPQRLAAVGLLEEAGYAVDQAATGSEALNTVRSAQGRYDAVILAVRLPDRLGDAVAAELRAMHADLPILLATGEKADDLRRRFADDRCIDVIRTPYDADRLVAALAALGVRCASKPGGRSE